MRRLLTALLAALLVMGLLPVGAFAGTPVADPQSVSTNEDTDLVIVLTANEAAGIDVTAFTPSTPAHGSLSATGTILCDGQTPDACSQAFTYSPDADYNGPDAFTFTATSDGAPSDAASVSITVNAVNDVPTFTVGSDVTVAEDSGPYGDPAFIANGSVGPADEAGQVLNYTVIAVDTGLFESQPAISPGGALSFTPATNANGTTLVSVTADDGAGGTSGSQSFSITITSVNDAPSFTKGPDVIAPTTGSVTRPAWATAISAGGGEADALTFELTPGNAALFASGPAIDATTGDLTFTPSGTAGSTTVQVKVTDDGSPPTSSGTQVFAITVLDGPAADPINTTVVEDSADNPITLTGTDPEGDPLTFAVATPPTHGTLTGNAPDLAYTPAPNFFGTDTLTYTASDGTTTSPAATVTITVQSGNDDPVLAKSDFVSVNATTTTTLNPLANDSGGAGESLAGVTISGVTKPSHGSATRTTANTRISYDPAGCWYGSDGFEYTITDGSSTSTKSIGVTVLRPGQGALSKLPLTDTPVVSFPTGATMFSTVPLRLSWCGVTASGSSPRTYRVLQSTNGGSTYSSTPLIRSTTSRSATPLFAINRSYRWKVRTTDTLSRIGAYRPSAVSFVRRYQENHPSIVYTGSWATSTNSSASSGAMKASRAAGAAATITISNARQFAIVGPKSATRGSFKVFVDGQLVATVSEKSTTTQYRKVLFVRSITTASHVIRIEAASGTRIDLDAILTLSAQ